MLLPRVVGEPLLRLNQRVRALLAGESPLPLALADCLLRELAPLIGIATATFHLRERGLERLRRVGADALADRQPEVGQAWTTRSRPPSLAP